MSPRGNWKPPFGSGYGRDQGFGFWDELGRPMKCLTNTTNILRHIPILLCSNIDKMGRTFYLAHIPTSLRLYCPYPPEFIRFLGQRWLGRRKQKRKKLIWLKSHLTWNPFVRHPPHSVPSTTPSGLSYSDLPPPFYMSVCLLGRHQNNFAEGGYRGWASKGFSTHKGCPCVRF